MEKEIAAAVGAAAGAAIVAVSAVVVDRIKTARTKKEHELDLVDVANSAYARGWYEHEKAMALQDPDTFDYDNLYQNRQQ